MSNVIKIKQIRLKEGSDLYEIDAKYWGGLESSSVYTKTEVDQKIPSISLITADEIDNIFK